VVGFRPRVPLAPGESVSEAIPGLEGSPAARPSPVAPLQGALQPAALGCLPRGALDVVRAWSGPATNSAGALVAVRNGPDEPVRCQVETTGSQPTSSSFTGRVRSPGRWSGRARSNTTPTSGQPGRRDRGAWNSPPSAKVRFSARPPRRCRSLRGYPPTAWAGSRSGACSVRSRAKHRRRPVDGETGHDGDLPGRAACWRTGVRRSGARNARRRLSPPPGHRPALQPKLLRATPRSCTRVRPTRSRCSARRSRCHGPRIAR
jgi:hypothetical protein